MYSVLFVIHVMVTVALIGIILVQRSASDGTGLSGSSSTSFISGRAAASFITHTTAILAAVFILTSLAMGVLTARSHDGGSIVDKIQTEPVNPFAPLGTTPAAPATQTAPATQAPATPAKPAVPRPE